MAEGSTVVVVDYDFANLDVERQVFGPQGVRLIARRYEHPRQVVQGAAGADGILVQYLQLGPEVMEACTRCRVIGRYGVGYDNVDVAAATAQNIAVVNVPSYGQDEVSDHALALILAWLRRIPYYDRLVRRGRWDWKLGRPMQRLSELTCGICGFGRIGRQLAPKLQALGFEVLAFDPYLDDDVFQSFGVSQVSFAELLRRADVISIHLPLNEETHHLFDAQAFAHMKSSALLVNTSRGPVVDTDALAVAIEDKVIAGACLDVLEKEPPGDHPLLYHATVLVTPHVAWYSEDSEVELRRKAAQGVLAVLAGRRPEGLVNHEVAQALKLAD